MLDHPFVRLSLKLFQIIPLIAGWIKKRPPLLKLVANSFFRYGGVSWILSQKWVKSSSMLQTAEILERLQKGSHPRVHVNACTHGNERVGARILDPRLNPRPEPADTTAMFGTTIPVGAPR